MKRQNLLIVFFDQLQQQVLSCYGGPARTPNFDRIARRGAQFDRAYCASPQCVPTRSSFQTSLAPHTHGAMCFGEGYQKMQPGLPLLTDRLHDAGYKVGVSGVWHVEQPEQSDRTGEYAMFRPEDFPFGPHAEALKAQQGESAEPRKSVQTPTDDGEKHAWNFSVPLPARWTGTTAEHTDMQRAQQVSEFIASVPSDENFAAVCSFASPHPPLLLPEPYFSMYDPAEVDLPAGLGESPEGEPAYVREAPGRQSVADWDEDTWRRAIAAYRGAASFADDCLGVVLESLERSGRLENTLVVCLADHGEMLGAHNLYQKCVPYEPAVRIPLAICGPDVQAGERRQLVSHVDLAPTILDLLGLDAVEGAHGQSLRGILADPAESGRLQVFTEFNGYIRGGWKWRAAISDRYKYVYAPGEPDLLFDLEKDPHEMHNLAGEKPMRSILTDMRRALGDWMRATGDTLDLPDAAG